MYELAESTEVRLIARISLGWMAVAGAAGIAIGVAAGSVALVGLGIYSALAGVASLPRAPRQAGLGLLLLAPALAAAATRGLLSSSHPDSSWLGIVLALACVLVIAALAHAKQQVGLRADSPVPALAALAGLLGNAALGAWWLDPVAALVIAGVALNEGRALWQGDCDC
jgi:divalent metal cation (Fe/Co/Zn/Cd) transporter